jgi:succinate dehydrogenase / fumarate reductase, membrane anchor subunit
VIVARPATEDGSSLMKESWNMIVTYVTAAVLVFVLTFHLLLQSPLTGKAFEDTLSFGYATGNLAYYQVVFGLLLFAAVIHGVNGLRVLAIEWLHPIRLGWLLNLVVLVTMAFLLALGTITLIVVG